MKRGVLITGLKTCDIDVASGLVEYYKYPNDSGIAVEHTLGSSTLLQIGRESVPVHTIMHDGVPHYLALTKEVQRILKMPVDAISKEHRELRAALEKVQSNAVTVKSEIVEVKPFRWRVCVNENRTRN